MREPLYESDFEIAEKNGIPRKNAYSRYYSLGWSKKRAITEPHRPRPKTHLKYKEQLEANGISTNIFYARLSYGWSEEKAANEPIMTREERTKRMLQVRHKDKRISDEIKELAEKNGIPLQTLRQRVYKYNKDPYLAATEPLKTQFRWRK